MSKLDKKKPPLTGKRRTIAARIREALSSSGKRQRRTLEKDAPALSVRFDHEENDKELAGGTSPSYSPQSKAIRLDPEVVLTNRCIAYLPYTPETEAYRVLRARIMHVIKEKGKEGNTIMVTSSLPGEGKTLTAINLSFIFARDFQHTVLLVDGDLRRQNIHKYLGCAHNKGLGDYLENDCPVSDLIIWPGIERMALICGGRPIKESAELLGSPRMKEFLSELKDRYADRTIIFDAPPILTGADIQTFVPLIDHVLIVVQAGKTSMDDVARALHFLPQEKILGFVLNRCQNAFNAYYKSYYS